MYISLNLNSLGESKLYLLPTDQDNVFILIKEEEDIRNPYMTLQLEGNRLKVCHKREILEDSEDLEQKLDELALEVIAAIQRGDDLADVNITSQIKPYNPERIRVESKTFSLRQIFDMIKNKDLNLHPDFQRNLVWDNFRKSRLIESILLRIPLPMFYFSQDEDGVLSVVDGLQRLSAIYEFMSNKLVLRDLEYLDNCNNRTYSREDNRIEDKYVRWFNMTQIVVNVIDPQSPSKVKYDIFRRINTGGRPLNAQELRNCLSSDNLRLTLKRMVALKSFRDATGGSLRDTRMGAQELALRFIFFSRLIDGKEGIKSYSGNMDEELDSLVDVVGKEPQSRLEEYISSFDVAMKNARHLFGKHAFRRIEITASETSPRSVINKALFASEAVLLAKYSVSDIKKYPSKAMIPIFANEMKSNTMYSYYLSYGTNGRNNIINAFVTADKLFKENLR